MELKMAAKILITLIVLVLIFLALSFFRSGATPLSRIAREIEKACVNGENEFHVSFPQQKPLLLFDGRDVISQTHDPAYILYYERFPISLSIPWDWLRRKEYPAVVYAILREGENKEERMMYLLREAQKITGREAEVVFINEMADGGSYFSKFKTCGKNSICLKRGDEIEAIELNRCGNVEFFIESPGWRILWVFNAGKRQYEFSFISPCKEKIKVWKGMCDCKAIRIPVFKDGEKIGTDLICDNRDFFGAGEWVKVPCLKFYADINYVYNYCYNFELIDKATLTTRELRESLLRATIGNVGTQASEIFELPPTGLRNMCFRKLDDYAVLFDPRCFEDMPVEDPISLDKVSSIWNIVKDIAKVKLASVQKSGDVVWEVWPLERPVVS